MSGADGQFSEYYNHKTRSKTKYYIGMLSISMAYIWDNISSKYGRNTFRYSVDSGTASKTVTFVLRYCDIY